MVLDFFGLTQNYRINLFEQIHSIVFNGQGGYDYATVYNMPTWLRKFTYKKLEQFYTQQQEEINKQQTPANSTSNIPKGPSIERPTYTTKANK